VHVQANFTDFHLQVQTVSNTIPSNAPTVEATTKLTLTFVFSENTGSIASGIQRNTKKFMIQQNN